MSLYRVLMTKVDRINDNVGKSQADYWGHTGRCNMDKSICNTGRALMTAGMGQKGGQA